MIEKCAICGHGLVNNYPDGYPDEWKFCCSCYVVAWIISSSPNKPKNILEIMGHLEECGFCRELLENDRAEVYKYITLVGKK